ncbi:MAG: FkbM family methyltransferase [Alphaproteobacteria bacterium]|nr:FkbM family methyltransferase [Alphaproteobacteria bacterium]
MNVSRLANLVYKSAINHTPYSVKYKAMTAWQRTLPPYHVVKPGDVVVQIGVAGHLCPMGRSQAILYSRLVGDTGKVLAFEAIPENLDHFCSYVTRHGITNIESKSTGLWNEKGTLVFDAPAKGPGSSRIKAAKTDAPYQYTTEREFPVDTLDHLLDEQGVERLDLINITTNCAETEIMEGGMKYLKRFKPTLCVPERPENLEYFEANLKPLGYTAQVREVRLHLLGSPFRVLWAERPNEQNNPTIAETNAHA